MAALSDGMKRSAREATDALSLSRGTRTHLPASSTTRLLDFFPALLAALFTSNAVIAQDAAPPPSAPPPSAAPPIDDLAQTHYDDGKAAEKKGDFQAAYTSYRAALAVQEHEMILGALGRAAHRSGRYRDAAEYLTRYLKSRRTQCRRTSALPRRARSRRPNDRSGR